MGSAKARRQAPLCGGHPRLVPQYAPWCPSVAIKRSRAGSLPGCLMALCFRRQKPRARGGPLARRCATLSRVAAPRKRSADMRVYPKAAPNEPKIDVWVTFGSDLGHFWVEFHIPARFLNATKVIEKTQPRYESRPKTNPKRTQNEPKTDPKLTFGSDLGHIWVRFGLLLGRVSYPCSFFENAT